MDWKKMIEKIWFDQTGATTVEYGLILALVFITMLGSVRAFGDTFIALWDTTSATIVAVSGS